MSNNSNKHSQYAVNRIIKDFGDLHTAKQNGITPVKAGIKFMYRSLDGQRIKYIPRKYAKRSNDYQTQKAKDKDGLSNPYAEKTRHLAKDYYRLRIDPQLIRGNSGKYKAPAKLQTGFFESLFLTNSTINAYKEEKQIDTLYLTEGEAKAAVMSQNGLVAAGFAGVSVFSMTDSLVEFVEVCRPQNIVILYDSDALDLSKNWEKNQAEKNEPVNKRVMSFLSSARKFSKQFFEFVKELNIEDYKPNLYYGQSAAIDNQKAIDDLIINLPDQKENIISSVQTLETSDYFQYIKLESNAYTYQLQNHFHLDSVNSFYDLHRGQIEDKTFLYNHCRKGCLKWRFSDGELTQVGTKKDINIVVPQGQKLASIAPQLIGIIESEIQKYGHAKIDTGAPMAIGKNHTTVNLLAPTLEKVTGYKSAIICPLNAIVQQTATTYGIEGMTGTPKPEQIQAAKEKSIFAINHNALLKVEKDFDKLNIFVDESHTLDGGSSYKLPIISKLKQSIDRVGHNKILLSATPSGYARLNGYQRVNILQKSSNTTSIYYQKSKKSKIKLIKRLLDNRAKDQVTVVKIQSKKQIRKIKNVLIEKNGFKENEIVILYSQKHIKELEQYKLLIRSDQNTNSFAPSVKVVLCTSFINEGINIYEDQRDIEFINVERTSYLKYTDLVQLVGRWRTDKDKTVYSFHPIDNPQQRLLDEHSHLAEYISKLQYYTALCNYLNSTNSNDDLIDKILDCNTVLLENERYVFTDDNGKYLVNESAIIADCEKTKKQYLRTDVAYKHLNELEGFEAVEVEEITDFETEEIIHDQLQEQGLQDKETEREAELKIIDLLQNDTLNFIGAVQNQSEKLEMIYLVSEHFPELHFQKELKLSCDKLVAEHRQLFTDHLSMCERTVKTLLNALSSGFDRENILELLIEVKTELRFIFGVGNMEIETKHLRSSRKLNDLFKTVNLHLALAANKIEGSSDIKMLTKAQKFDIEFVEIAESKILRAFDGGGGRLSDQRLKFIINREYENYISDINKTIVTGSKLKLSTNKTNPPILKRLVNSLFVCSRVGKRKDWKIDKTISMLDHIKNEFNLSNFDPSKLLKNAQLLAEERAKKQPEMVKEQKQGANPCIQGLLW